MAIEGMAAIGAAAAVGIAAIATAYTQAKIGAAGVGALAEDDSLFGQVLVLTVIPETMVIFRSRSGTDYRRIHLEKTTGGPSTSSLTISFTTKKTRRRRIKGVKTRMGLEDVKNEIIEDAKQEKKQLLEDAQEEADEIISEGEEKADKIRTEAEEEVEEKKKALEQRTESNANMEAKKIKLEAKQNLIQDTFEEFRERLENLSEDEKRGFVQNAVENAGFKVGTIRGSKSFSGIVKDYDFEEVDEEGIVLISEDGERRVNYMYDKILEDFKQDYRKKVAERLFN